MAVGPRRPPLPADIELRGPAVTSQETGCPLPPAAFDAELRTPAHSRYVRDAVVIEITEPGGRARDLVIAIAAALEDQLLAAIAVILSREAPLPDCGFARITVPVGNVGAAAETIQRVLEVTGDDGFGVVRLGHVGC